MLNNTPKTPISTQNFDLEQDIMSKITSGQIKMKPRWYFVIGSLAGFISLISTIITSVYLTNIVFFLLRSHGPMGQWRLERLINNFPWWILIIAIVSMVISIKFLQKYDFAYKQNFHFIIIVLIASIIIAGLVIDTLGLNEMWARRGPMRRFYQRIQLHKEVETIHPKGMYPQQRKLLILYSQ